MTPRRPLLAFLATLAASVGARAATVGPIENLPAAQAIGREAFPVDPIGRTWTYRRPDGTSVERKVLAQWPPYVFKNILVVSPDDLRMRGIQSTSFDLTGHLTFQKGAWLWATAHAWRLSEVDWRYSGPWVGAGIKELEGDWQRFPLHSGVEWTSAPFEMDDHGADPWNTRATTTHRVVGRASVEVPAGTFPETAVIESTSLTPEGSVRRRAFYAPTIGPVLEQTLDESGDWRTVLELEIDRPGAGYVGHVAGLELVPSAPGARSPSWAHSGPVEDAASPDRVKLMPRFLDSSRWVTSFLSPRDGTHERTPIVSDSRVDRVLGRARVVTPAGSFENAVVVETSEPARDDVTERPIRRTYYAANVGPVLVLVPEKDRWVADLVLESYSVPPAEPARQRAATGAAPTKHPNAARAARAPAP